MRTVLTTLGISLFVLAGCTGQKQPESNFILMHSVGSIPHNAEIDVPLNYADYYFLEGLTHKKELEK